MSRALRLGLIGAALALIFIHCWQFRDFCVDDAAISFAYSRNLAAGHGLVGFPGGERVEGYSNFLWVLLMAAGIRVGIDVFLFAKVMGFGLAMVTVLGTAELARRVRGAPSPMDGLAALATATLTPVAYFSMSGLEGPLYLALLVFCAVRLLREVEDPALWPLSALLAAGLALTRPDGLLLVAVAGMARLICQRNLRAWSQWKPLFLWGIVAAVPVGLHLAWRLYYYAYPYPNTYYLKAGAVANPFHLRELWTRSSAGWKYIIELVEGYRLRYWIDLAVVAAPLAVLTTRRWRPALIMVSFFFALLFFPIYSRGDWMSEGRFVVSMIPFLTVLALLGLEYLAQAVPRAWPLSRVSALSRLPIVWLAVPLSLLLLYQLGQTSLKRTRARRGKYPIPVELVGLRAKEYRRIATELQIPRPSALEADLGGTSWYAGMPIVDMVGLCDVTVAHFFDQMGLVQDYVFGERRPTFARLWWKGLGDTDDYQDTYIHLRRPGVGYESLTIARTVFLADGVDTRTPLKRLGQVSLLGYDRTADSVELWLLVHGAGLELRVASGTRNLPVSAGNGIFRRGEWRAGEVIRAGLKLPSADEALQLCEGLACAPIERGPHGNRPLPTLLPPVENLAQAEAQGELEVALQVAKAHRSKAEAARLARLLYQRGTRRRKVGDLELAFADFGLAIDGDPTLAWARRRREELRPLTGTGRPHRARRRLREAVGAFQLAPSPETLNRLLVAVELAAEPQVAVRAHQATALLPTNGHARVVLAESYWQLGHLARAQELLPEVKDLAALRSDDRARALRVARLGGEGGRTAALQKLFTEGTAVKARPIAPGLELVDAWVALRSSGLTELAFALRATGSGELSQDGITVTAAGRSLTHLLARKPAAGEITVERQLLDLPAGKTSVGIGSTTLTIEVDPFTADFESGRLDGWTATGNAFDGQPASRRPRPEGAWSPFGHVAGYSGVRLIDTIAIHGDAARGELRSPVLNANVDQVCFVVGGGADARQVGVRIDSGPTRMPGVAGRNDATLRGVCLSTSGLTRPDRRIVIYDFSANGWGHVLADDFECMAGGEPVPCAGSARLTGN